MAGVLVDTDVCIDHLAGLVRLPGRRARLGYSVITRAELRAGANGMAETEAVRRLLGTMTEYPVDRQIADEAGRIRQEHGLRLPDALIAATALVHGLAVHTRNRRHFARVSGLRLRPGPAR
ncbi:MAG TPA: type II toxin-antitoxin system VapC family toxin [Jatrophihabitans sp.]|nr:type II toxin-antitoxin system VapC family toxin [Jatrophihabitans sp.]